MFEIREVEGTEHAVTLNFFNELAPEIFPPLEPRHIECGFWWLGYHDGGPIAFAGLVAMEPFPNVGYLKRAYVLPDYRGHGLQQRFMSLREAKARNIGWTMLVSECAQNSRSSHNFALAGYAQCDPEQKWGAPNSSYWIKHLT